MTQKSSSTPRKVMMTLRVTADERDAIRAVADDLGMSVSDLLRTAPFGVGEVKKHLETRVPELHREIWTGLAPVLSNLNQLTRSANRMTNFAASDGLNDRLATQFLELLDVVLVHLAAVERQVHDLRRAISATDS